MTVATQLSTLKHAELDVTLFIEGIPYVFGTRAGLSHPMTDMDGNTLTNMGATTSVSALPPEGIELGSPSMDWETLIMQPASMSFTIASSSTWDQYFMRRLDDSFNTSELSYSGTTVQYPYYYWVDAPAKDKAMLYCGRESMQITFVDSPPYFKYTVTRAYADFPGTQARHDSGETFYFSPPTFIGRRCEVRIWLGGTTQRVVYGVIQASPSFDAAGMVWKIQAKDTMSMLDRKIAVGMTGGAATFANFGIDINGSNGVEILASPEWVDEVGADTAEEAGHLLVKDSDGHAAICNIASFDVLGVAMRVLVSQLGDVDMRKINEARRCYLLKGYPMRAALSVLMSKAGGNTQSVTITGSDRAIGDRYFGTALDVSANQPLVYGQEKRFGASIHKIFLDVWSNLDTSDLAEAVRTHVPGFCYTLGLNGEEDLLGFLSEVAHACAGFWFLNYKGQISFRRLGPLTPGAGPSGQSLHTITDDHLARDGSSWISLDDESEALATQTIECNWDPMAAKYLATFNLIDRRVHEAYREKANNAKAQRRGLYVRVPGAPQSFVRGLNPGLVDREMFRTQMERIAVWRNQGLRKYNLRLPWKFSLMQPGDRISLTSNNLIDFNGVGSRLSGFNLMALQVKLDVKGPWVDVEAVEMRRAYVLPPVLEVASYDAGTKTITLKTGASLEWDSLSYDTPTDWIDGSAGGYSTVIGTQVILDESASPAYSARAQLAIASITATTIVLTATTGITPAAGDLIHTTLDSVTDTSANIYGHTQDDLAFGSNYISPTDMTQDAPPYGWSLWIDGDDHETRRWK